MEEYRGVDIETFQELPWEKQRAYLRHPSWPVRCRCRAWGFPWPALDAVTDENGWKHTTEICAPKAEFLD